MAGRGRNGTLREARRLDAFDALRAWLSRIQTGSRLRSLAPHGVVALLVSSFIGYMGYYTWLQHLRRQTSGFDLGYYATFFWNTLHGRPFYCPITHPRDGSYLSIHTEPAVYLLAPLYALRPDLPTWRSASTCSL